MGKYVEEKKDAVTGDTVEENKIEGIQEDACHVLSFVVGRLDSALADQLEDFISKTPPLNN